MRGSISALAARANARWLNICACGKASATTTKQEKSMTLKFSNKPQLSYGNQGSVSDIWRRFPEGAQPIATAPERSATPIIVHEPNGTAHWALHHHGAWRKLAPFKDWRSGAVSWRMDGTEIANPVAWSLPRKE